MQGRPPRGSPGVHQSSIRRLGSPGLAYLCLRLFGEVRSTHMLQFSEVVARRFGTLHRMTARVLSPNKQVPSDAEEATRIRPHPSKVAHSSRGLGYHPFKVETRVRVPYALPVPDSSPKVPGVLGPVGCSPHQIGQIKLRSGHGRRHTSPCLHPQFLGGWPDCRFPGQWQRAPFLQT